MPPPTDAQKRLTAARDKARRLAMGPPLSMTDEESARLAKPGPEMRAELEAYIRDAAGEFGAALFNARKAAE